MDKKTGIVNNVRRVNTALLVFSLCYTILFFVVKLLHAGGTEDDILDQSKELIIVGVSGIITFSFFKFPVRKV